MIQGPNRSDRYRRTLIISYRTADNFPLYLSGEMVYPWMGEGDGKPALPMGSMRVGGKLASSKVRNGFAESFRCSHQTKHHM